MDYGRTESPLWEINFHQNIPTFRKGETRGRFLLPIPQEELTNAAITDLELKALEAFLNIKKQVDELEKQTIIEKQLSPGEMNIPISDRVKLVVETLRDLTQFIQHFNDIMKGFHPPPEERKEE